jgi:hypothetical protein
MRPRKIIRIRAPTHNRKGGEERRVQATRSARKERERERERERADSNARETK